MTTNVEVLKTSGITRIWVPAALLGQTPFQKTLSNVFKAEGGTAKTVVASNADALGIIAAEFPSGVRPILTITSRIATSNYAAELSTPGKAPKESRAELEYFLRPTKLLPTDGIVKTTATEITKKANTDTEKARAIYEWIVDNTFRNPKTRGCGTGGSIRFMLGVQEILVVSAPILTAPLCGSRARGRASSARRVWHPNRQVGAGVQKAWAPRRRT